MNVVSRSCESSYSMGAGIEIFAYGLNLFIGSSACLYFFNILSEPVDRISPVANTINNFCYKSVL
jgi:hypothetical protein